MLGRSGGVVSAGEQREEELMIMCVDCILYIERSKYSSSNTAYAIQSVHYIFVYYMYVTSNTEERESIPLLLRERV